MACFRQLSCNVFIPLNDVEVKASSIGGLGLFLARCFHVGERIREINVVREVTPYSPLRKELGERADHCDYPNGKVVLLGVPDRHINHDQMKGKHS